MWFQIGILIASALISYVLRPKAKAPAAGTMDDFDYPQFEEGTPQMMVFGDVWIDDVMVVGMGNFRTTPIRR